MGKPDETGDGTVVLAGGLRFPEGPAFDAAGRLWAVELLGGTLLRRERDGKLERLTVGGMPNGIALRGDEPWFCDAERGAIRKMDRHGCVHDVTTPGRPALDRPNDLAFDRLGNLVFTCPGNSRTEPTGAVWRRATDGTLGVVAEGLLFPNGLAFAPGGDELVVAETYAHRLWRGRWDADSGRWHGSPWAHVGGPIGPDGMAFDEEGMLYVVIFDQRRIVVVAPDGSIARTLPVPGARPTNVAFDPVGDLGLVVTEAEHGVLLSIPQVGARGLPLYDGLGPAAPEL